MYFTRLSLYVTTRTLLCIHCWIGATWLRRLFDSGRFLLLTSYYISGYYAVWNLVLSQKYCDLRIQYLFNHSRCEIWGIVGQCNISQRELNNSADDSELISWNPGFDVVKNSNIWPVNKLRRNCSKIHIMNIGQL